MTTEELKRHIEDKKKLIVPMIEAFAAMERSGSHDARNEASVEFARDVVAMMRENNTYFPYI
jgi:hypothetical protein